MNAPYCLKTGILQVAGSEAELRERPKEGGTWRGKPVPTDLTGEMIFRTERLPPNGVLTHKLKPHHCRWPVSKEGEPYRFCGRPKAIRTFCEEHGQLAYYRQPEGKRALPR